MEQRFPDINDSPVTGLGERLDDLINDKFRSLSEAVRRLQQTQVLQTQAVEPRQVYTGELEIADGANWSPVGNDGPEPVWYDGAEWRPFGAGLAPAYGGLEMDGDPLAWPDIDDVMPCSSWAATSTAASRSVGTEVSRTMCRCSSAI